MRISDWSSDVCSSDLAREGCVRAGVKVARDAEVGHGAQLLVHRRRIQEATPQVLVGQVAGCYVVAPELVDTCSGVVLLEPRDHRSGRGEGDVCAEGPGAVARFYPPGAPSPRNALLGPVAGDHH